MDSAISINKDLADATLHSLESLGIEHTVNALSIELEDDAFHGPRRACFNPTTKKWKLSQVTELPARINRSSDFHQHEKRRRTSERQSSHGFSHHQDDWTSRLPQTNFVDFFKSYHWSGNPLGQLQDWEPSLQQYVQILLADSSAAVIYWGPHLISIHNDLMSKLAVNRLHAQTHFMGQPFKQAWPQLIDTWHPLFDRIRASGLAEDTVNIELYPTREYGVEETFFSGTVLPLRDINGQVEGFYNRAGETTRETLRERRTATLNAIASPSDLLIGCIWDHVFNAFRNNQRDFPLAFAFSANDDMESGRCMLQLQASIGVPTHHGFVQTQCLYFGKGGFMPSMRKARAENRMVLLQKADGTLTDELLEGFQWSGFGEPSSVLAIVPIVAGERLVSMVVIGLNPRRPYDSEYENFMNSLVRQMSATVISAIDHEESIAREQRLQAQLQNSEKQIRNLAEFAPMGMCRIAPSGNIIWANDQFYEISGHEKSPEAHYELSFVDIVLEEDQSTSAGLWPVLLEERKKVSVALRMKRKWTPPTSPGNENPAEEHAW